jgi:hypothetical protein
MGVLGAVVATLVTQFIVSLLQFRKSHLIFDLGTSTKEAVKVLLYIVVAIGSFVVFHDIGLKWFYNVVVLIAFNLTFAFFTGLLNFKFFLNILKFRS